MKRLTHDETIKELFEQYKLADKKRYTDFFLSGLTDINCNSGLYVYAVMKTFPKHNFTEREQIRGKGEISCEFTEEQKSFDHMRTPCNICSSYRQNLSDGKNYPQFFLERGFCADNVYERLYVLKHINELDQSPKICVQDFDMLKEIILQLRNADPEAKIRDIHKQFSKCDFYKTMVTKFKLGGKKKGASVAAGEKIKFILETLGVCGVLHTEKHIAPFYDYLNIAVSNGNPGNWQYPVSFWKGKDGIDWNAFDYWFGEYKEFANITN